VVAVQTGNVLKDPGIVMEYHAKPGPHRNPPIAIKPALSEVERLLKRWKR
jgi:hypothetical protein